MGQTTGHYLSLSRARRAVADIMYFSQGRPLIPIERVMELGGLVELRRAIPAERRPGWCSIFTHAYSLLCSRTPALRRSYLPYPTPRLFESDQAVAAIAVERELDGEPAVLAGVLTSPHERSLQEIEAFLQSCKRGPLHEVRSIRRTLRYLNWPRAVRRLLWGWVLNWHGRKRAEYFGTFGVSVTAGMGASTLALLSPLTTTLHYGRFEPDGRLPVRITFDHRVLDAGVLARGMAELERILKDETAEQLRALAPAAEALRQSA